MKINFNVKYIGTAIILIGLVLTFVTWNLSNDMLKLVDNIGMAMCNSVGTCPHVLVLNYSYMFYTISIVLFLIGLVMFFFEEQSKLTETKKRKWDEKSDKLSGDDKLVYDIIKNSDGVIYQSKLVEKSGLGKVKVSRILDKLQTTELLERKRRGMSNVIILK